MTIRERGHLPILHIARLAMKSPSVDLSILQDTRRDRGCRAPGVRAKRGIVVVVVFIVLGPVVSSLCNLVRTDYFLPGSKKGTIHLCRSSTGGHKPLASGQLEECLPNSVLVVGCLRQPRLMRFARVPCPPFQLPAGACSAIQFQLLLIRGLLSLFLLLVCALVVLYSCSS